MNKLVDISAQNNTGTKYIIQVQTITGQLQTATGQVQDTYRYEGYRYRPGKKEWLL